MSHPDGYEWRVVPYRRAGDALVEGGPRRAANLTAAQGIAERLRLDAERLGWNVPPPRIERRLRPTWQVVSA